MNIYSLTAVVAFTINFSMGLMVLLENPRATLNRWFSAFIFSFALWNLSEIIILNSASLKSALFAAQVMYRIIFLTPALYVVIAYLFPRNVHPRVVQPPFYLLLFALPVILLVASFPHFQIQIVPLQEPISTYYYHIHFTLHLTFILLVTVFFAYSLWGSLVLISKIPRLKTARQKSQTRFLLFGVLTIFLLFIILNTLRQFLLREVTYYFLSTSLSFIISLFFLIAILQYRLFKISRLISEGITYSILSSIALAVYFIVIKSLSESVTELFGISSFIFEAGIILLLIILIRPLANRIQQAVDRLLYRDIRQYRRHFLNFSRELLTYMEPEPFFKKIENFLTREFHLEEVLIFLKNEQGNFTLFGEKEKTVEIPEACYLTHRLLRMRRTVEYYDLHLPSIQPHIAEFMEQKSIRVLLPLIFEEKLMAIIALSRRRFDQEFSDEILDILTIFANEAATAYQRNLMIDRMRREEWHRYRLEHLAELGQLTAHLAHEIRNPLNTITTAGETLLRKQLSPEDEKELKKFIVEEAARLNRILDDYLSYSRMRPPQIAPIHLAHLFERVIALLETEDTHIRFEKVLHFDPPLVHSDEDLLSRALLNLGLNARQAVEAKVQHSTVPDQPSGKICFEAKRRNGEIVIAVIDNGIGIPTEKQKTIFEPFYTTKENGTGLGLSITRNIIEALGGRITVESSPGQTIFTILLPDAPAGKTESVKKDEAVVKDLK